MRIEEIDIGNSVKYFQAGDYISLNEYILIDNNRSVIRNGEFIQTEIPIELSMPQITIIDKTRFLISEYDIHSSKLNAKSKNAWMLNEKGKLLSHFNIGQANRLLSTDELIIASYSPSGFYTGINPEFEVGGLAVFDFEGKCLFHLDSILPKEVNFFEIKAMSNFDNQFVCLLTYPNFDILKLNLKNFQLSVEQKLMIDESNIDDEFWIPSAISRFEKYWYFFTSSSENQESIVFKRNLDSKISRIGSCNYAVFPKGMADGEFLVPSSSFNGSTAKCQVIKCKDAV